MSRPFVTSQPPRRRRTNSGKRSHRSIRPSLEGMEDRTLLTAGDLDITFGAGGRVITPCQQYAVGAGMAVQPDDRVVVVLGEPISNNGSELFRYDTDGRLDPSFNGTGRVATGFGPAFDVALQPDGKILVAGSAHDTDFALARFNTDGSPDLSFNGTGRVTTDLGGSQERAYAIGVARDGKIVLGGVSSDGGTGHAVFALARYNPDGSPDLTFSGTGKVTTDFGPYNDVIQGLTIQVDGRIVVAGYTNGGTGVIGFALARYQVDGTLDPSFGVGGKVVTDFGLGDDAAYDVAIQPDEKIVASGYAGAPRSQGSYAYDVALARYQVNGTLDTSFGAPDPLHPGLRMGTTVLDLGADQDYVGHLALQSNGKIVVAGSTWRSGTNYDFALARFAPDGTVDTNFGANGIVTTPFGAGDTPPNNDMGSGVAIDSQERIVLAGYTTPPGSMSDIALARYTSRDLPTARDDTYTVEHAGVLSVPSPGVLANDFGDGLSAVKVTDPLHGSLTLNVDGSFIYTPNPAYGGLDSFAYKATDGKLTSDFATVSITVLAPPNHPPIANDATARITAGAPFVDIHVTATDPDNDPLTITIVSQPPSGIGTADVNDNGTPGNPRDDFIRFTPVDGAIPGYYSFNYKVNDRQADSNVATVTVHILPLLSVNLIAYRMTNPPFESTLQQVPVSEKESPGIPIRMNTDDDDGDGVPDNTEQLVTDEADLVKVTLTSTGLQSVVGVRYVLVRSNANIQVWKHPYKGGQPLFPDSSLNTSTIDLSSGSRDLYVEYVSSEQNSVHLCLQVRDFMTGAVVLEDTVHFYADPSLPNARDIGFLGTPRTFSDSLADPDNNNFTEFEIFQPSVVTAIVSSNGFKCQADLSLWNDMGSQPPIDISNHGLIEKPGGVYLPGANSVSRIMEPGIYYIQITNHVHAKAGRYTLQLQSAPLVSSDAIKGKVIRNGASRVDDVALERVNADPQGDKRIVAPVTGGAAITTWVVIHGRTSKAKAPDILNLATAIDGYKAGDQVLTLDWQESAAAAYPLDISGAAWIQDVGNWAAHALDDLGLSTDHINLVGHSWGTYVSYEIAKDLSAWRGHNVNSIIALDPAIEVPFTAFDLYPANKVNFSEYSLWSWAFWSSWLGGITGLDPSLATTAAESFATDVGWGANAHGDCVRLFTRMLQINNQPILSLKDPVSTEFSLAAFDTHRPKQWDHDSYSHHPLATYPGFDALLKGTQVGSLWAPDYLQYQIAGWGYRVTTVPDAFGKYTWRDIAGNTFDSAFSLRADRCQSVQSWIGASNLGDCFSITMSSAMPVLRINLSSASSTLLFDLYPQNYGVIYINQKSLNIRLFPGKYYIRIRSTVQNDHFDNDPYTLSLAAGPR